MLTDLLLVRRLQPYHVNIGKRLIKSPKTFIRDSGLLHTLLKIETFDDMLGHPIVGAGWEGFVIENLLANTPKRTQPGFYRTSAGAEIDLVLDMGQKNGLWTIEIKRSLTPKIAKGFTISKGFTVAREDIAPQKSFIVYNGKDRYPKTKEIDVISITELAQELFSLSVDFINCIWVRCLDIR